MKLLTIAMVTICDGLSELGFLPKEKEYYHQILRDRMYDLEQPNIKQEPEEDKEPEVQEKFPHPYLYYRLVQVIIKKQVHVHVPL